MDGEDSQLLNNQRLEQSFNFDTTLKRGFALVGVVGAILVLLGKYGVLE